MEQGDDENSIFYVLKGSCQFYKIIEGQKKVNALLDEGNMLLSIPSFLFHLPAEESIEACEPGVLYEIKAETWDKLRQLEYRPEFLDMQLAALEKAMAFQKKINHLMHLSNSEKVSYLHKKLPWLVNRFSVKNLALLLGMTSASYCRTVAKMNN